MPNDSLNQLNEESRKIGSNDTAIDEDTAIKVDDEVIGRVDIYVYLGYKLKMGLENQK